MSIIIYSRPERCRGCIHLESYKDGNLKRHRCKNTNSENHGTQRTLRDLVCRHWENYDKSNT